MTLYKRKGSKAWYYDFEFEGQRYNASTRRTNKREAQQFEDDLKRKLRERAAGGIREEWTVRKVIETYSEFQRDRLRDWPGVESNLSKFERIVGGDTLFHELNSASFAACRREIADLKPSTQQTFFARVRALINWMEDHHAEVARPEFKMPKIKVTGKIRYLREGEEEKLMAALDNPPVHYVAERYADLKDFVVFLIDTGVRVSEAAHLTRDNVFPSRRVCEVYREKTDTISEVPLSDRVLEIVERRLRGGNSKWLFPHFDNPQLPRPIASPSLLNIYDRAGLNTEENVRRYGEFTTHSLRHTYATRMARAGISPVKLKELMGHSNINTTMKYVQLVSQDSISDALAILNSGWSRVPEKSPTSTELRSFQ